MKKNTIRQALFSSLGSRLDLRGGVDLTVHGVTRILAYSPEKILLALSPKEGNLEVRGGELLCTSYLVGAVQIEGRIDSVGFLREEKS